MKNSKNKSVFLMGQAGCFLPLLILFNLFFGWLFFKPTVWLLIEAILVLLFILNTYILAKKISSFSSQQNTNAIDIEGEVLEDKPKLK